MPAKHPTNLQPSLDTSDRQSIATSLVILVIAAVVPILVFSIGVAWMIVHQQQNAREEQLSSMVRALRVAVDRELASQISAVAHLAEDVGLEPRGFPRLNERARVMVATKEDWQNAVIVDVKTHLVVEGTASIPESAIKTFVPNAIDEAVKSRKAVLAGTINTGKNPGQASTMFVAPIFRNDEVRYALVVSTDPQHLSNVLKAQQLPDTWVGAVLDSALVVSGHSRFADRIGRRTTDSLAKPILASESGMFITLTFSNDRVYTVFNRSPTTNWSVAIGIPEAEVDGPIRDTLWKLAAVGGALMMFALLLSGMVGRAITRRRDAYVNAIHEANQFNKQVITSANEGIIVYGHDLRYKLWNRYMEELSGLSSSEVIGKHPFEVFPFLQETGVLSRLEGVLAGERPELVEFPFKVEQTGRSGWASDRSAPMKDANGAIIGIIAAVTDITERKRSSEQVENLLIEQKAMLDSRSVGIAKLKDRKYVWLNNAFAMMLGYTAGELVGQSVRIIYSSDEDYAEFAQNAYPGMQNGDVYRAEYQFLRKDGALGWYDICGSMLKPGSAESIWGFVDITERKRAEEALKESGIRHQLLFESSRDALMTLTPPSWKFTGANHATLKLFGIASQTEFTTLGPWNISPAMQPDGSRSAEKAKEMIEIAMREGSHFFEWVHQRLDGTRFTADVLLTRMTVGENIFLQGTVRDITERKKAEEELAHHRDKLEEIVAKRSAELAQTEFLKDQALDLARAGPWRIDFEESSEYYISSRRIVEILGDPLREDFRYHFMNDWYANIAAADKAAAAATLANFQAAVDGHIPRYDIFHPYKRPSDGAIVWVHVIGEIVRDGEGKPKHLYGVVMDVTPMKRAEDELRLAKEVAETANQTKDTFLANISHELRTPLSAVIGMANLAHGISTEPKLRDYLEKIARSGKHLNRIINELLDLSKIAAGHMELEITSFRLHNIVEHVESVITPRAAEKGLVIVKTIDAAVPDILLGDPTRIEQIFLNLLGNAIKFTGDGRIEVRIKLQAREKNRVCLNIEFEDTGIGIRPETIAQLFKPFTQADATVSRKYGGTGLGLAISRRLAEMMDGDITAASIEGRGTTFKVILWLGLGNADDLPATQLAANEVLPALYQDVRILVADDQPLNREIVEALLAEVGITPVMAENGQEVLDILTEPGPDTFDLILMDVQMPIMDGLSATRTLRSLSGFEKLPIVAMTAHTMAHEIELTIAAGMNDHIGKPFDNASFYRALAKWLPVHKKIEAIAPVDLAGKDADQSLAENELSTLHGVDVYAALRRFGSNETRYRHWLAEFVSTAGAVPDQIRSEIAAGHKDNAAKTAHAFKGRVGMLGMTDLHSIIVALESALRDDAPAGNQIAVMEQSIDRMREQLARVLLTNMPDAGHARGTVDRVVWSDAYSVSVPEMDEQHKKLIGMINQLAVCDEARSPDSSETFHEVLSGMFDYTQVHFKAEEEYLKRIGYPQLAAHENEHTEFVEKMTSFSMVASDGKQDCAGAYHFMKGWLLSHILKSDMQYRHFVEGRKSIQ